MDEHKISLEEFYERVQSSSRGLSSDEAQIRLKKFGANILVTKQRFKLLFKFIKQFANFFSILLSVGSLLAFFAEYLAPGQGNLYIGIALIGVVILNAIFSFLQEYQTEKIMEGFKKMLPLKASVLRNGAFKEVLAEEIAIGDVIYLTAGDKVPVDARLIEEYAMKVDHSSITGESEPQLRKLECTHENILETRNVVLSGTLVNTGNGKAVVFATGMNTQIGKIVKLTNEAEEVETPLYKEINYFIKRISALAIFLGASFFIVSLIIGRPFLGSIIFAIGIIVANVPEGLLPTITFALSIASRRMAKKNALIKSLESVETLGSTTIICTDKTGTLTENKMSVATIVLGIKELSVNDESLKKSSNLLPLLKTMVLCNNSQINGEEVTGDPSETALINFSRNIFDITKIIGDERRLDELPFDSKTKRMITVNKSGNAHIAYLKGAPEVVLNKCSTMLIDGKKIKLDAQKRKRIEGNYVGLASRGERVLGFAFKEIRSKEFKEEEFTFIGIVGMKDPPRKEVPEAIKKCKSAGIRVIMITGDHSITAKAIAAQIGLIDTDSPNLLTGEELDKFSDIELQSVVKKDNLIFARTNPIHKLRIVKALQANGEIVTVTGDGVNDAPALKNADMGVAMGLSGTEVAREASDMVLMDDNFATIVNAVEEGRTVYENIKKFLAYILTSNVPEILPFIAFVLFHIPLPLTVVLILSIDIGTDLLPAIGLGTEKPEIDVMAKKPRSRKERLLTPNLFFRAYGIVGMIQAMAGFVAYFYVLFSGGWQWGQQLAYNDPLYMRAITAFFAAIIITQIADVITCRTRRQSFFTVGLFSNKLVLIGIIVELIILAIYSYVPLANRFFGTGALSFWDLAIAVPFAVLIFVGAEIRKYLLRRDNQFVKKYLTW